jgi:hypothetical protein
MNVKSLKKMATATGSPAAADGVVLFFRCQRRVPSLGTATISVTKQHSAVLREEIIGCPRMW